MNKDKYDEILSKTSGSVKSKLERIRRFLYLDKASVMVGAGFSINAEYPTHIKVKRWCDVGKDIYCRLQSVKEPKIEELVFKTPMRIASQFAATFGRSELDNLIKDSIPDNSLTPGSLHKQLLSLPWRDIFTTNYDTLLERGCDTVGRSYSVITTKEMLLYKKSPRIIKLHGSFPDKTPFLMTEEDYRTYPTDHPEFVNTVRQALVESIFCLIGFSGDDPNFTSWIGWLHDIMGDYAGPSYLITWEKDYDESFKVLMGRRGVDVINLHEIEGINDHKTALDFFFTYMSEQSSNWNGHVSYSAREINAEELIKKLKDIRLSYPGWFILPKKYYEQFSDVETVFPSLEYQFKTIEEKLKEPFLAELDWRTEISLTFKDFDWFRDGIETIIHSYGNKPLSDDAINLGLSLLRLYRYHPEKVEERNALIDRLLREQTRMTSYQDNRFHYILSCNALSSLDFESVEKELMQWHTTSYCYEGVIYKSLVLAETGKVVLASKLLEDAYERITHSLSQNDNIKEQSIRFALSYLMAFYNHERILEENDPCAFADVRSYLLGKAIEPARESFEIKHNFGIGAESHSWHFGGGINSLLLHPYRLVSLYEAYGMPYSLSEVPVDEKIFSQTLPIFSGFGLCYSLGVVFRCVSRNVTESYATRTTMNSLSRYDADSMAQFFLDRYAKLSNSNNHLNREFNVILPFLSRLASLCSQEIVIQIFNVANEIYRKSTNTKGEYLSLIYSCIFPQSIQEIYSTIFSSELFSDIHNNDIPLPSSGYDYYSPSETEIDIACEGLNSTEINRQESAYYRTQYLLTSKIAPSNKTKLETAIRRWRSIGNDSRLSRHSYKIVKCSTHERPGYNQLVSDTVGKFRDGDYSFNGSSVSISSLANDLHNVALVVPSINEKQISEVLNKITDILEVNYGRYSTDDSTEMMGGLRHFTVEVFQSIEFIVKAITECGFSDVKSCAGLFDVLKKYMPTHLPVRLSMVRLNIITHSLSNSAIRDSVTDVIFSDNQSDVIDSCNALIAFSQDSNAIQTIIQKMIFYCNHANNDKMRLYLQTFCMIPYFQMKKTSKKLLAAMMIQLLKNISEQGFSDEQKLDIMHDGVKLAAILKKENDDADIEKAVIEWEKYANDDANYNDVRQPWFI